MLTATNSDLSHQTTCALASSHFTQETGNVIACSIARLAEREPGQDSEGKRDYTFITYSACSRAICGYDGVMIEHMLWVLNVGSCLPLER